MSINPPSSYFSPHSRAMARVLSFSSNYVRAPSPAPTTSNSVKPIFTLVLSAPCFNKPVRLVGNAGRDQKLAIVAGFRGGRGGFDLDDDIFSDMEEEEEEELEPEYDPNLDLDRIESKTVRLLDEESNMIGVLPLREAIRKADNSGLMLMIVSAESNPPVLRLFEEGNYQKFKFEKQKKKRSQQRKQATRSKEVKLGYNIDGHDYSVRLKQATKFLKEGRKVKVIVTLRGREFVYRDQAIDLLRQFQNDIGQLASEESSNFIEKSMYINLIPNKANIQREQQLKQREEELKKKQAEANTEANKEAIVEANSEEQPKTQETEATTSTEGVSVNV